MVVNLSTLLTFLMFISWSYHQNHIIGFKYRISRNYQIFDKFISHNSRGNFESINPTTTVHSSSLVNDILSNYQLKESKKVIDLLEILKKTKDSHVYEKVLSLTEDSDLELHIKDFLSKIENKKNSELLLSILFDVNVELINQVAYEIIYDCIVIQNENSLLYWTKLFTANNRVFLSSDQVKSLLNAYKFSVHLNCLKELITYLMQLEIHFWMAYDEDGYKVTSFNSEPNLSTSQIDRGLPMTMFVIRDIVHELLEQGRYKDAIGILTYVHPVQWPYISLMYKLTSLNAIEETYFVLKQYETWRTSNLLEPFDAKLINSIFSLQVAEEDSKSRYIIKNIRYIIKNIIKNTNVLNYNPYNYQQNEKNNEFTTARSSTRDLIEITSLYPSFKEDSSSTTILSISSSSSSSSSSLSSSSHSNSFLHVPIKPPTSNRVSFDQLSIHLLEALANSTKENSTTVSRPINKRKWIDPESSENLRLFEQEIASLGNQKALGSFEFIKEEDHVVDKDTAVDIISTYPYPYPTPQDHHFFAGQGKRSWKKSFRDQMKFKVDQNFQTLPDDITFKYLSSKLLKYIEKSSIKYVQNENKIHSSVDFQNFMINLFRSIKSKNGNFGLITTEFTESVEITNTLESFLNQPRKNDIYYEILSSLLKISSLNGDIETAIKILKSNDFHGQYIDLRHSFDTLRHSLAAGNWEDSRNYFQILNQIKFLIGDTNSHLISGKKLYRISRTQFSNTDFNSWVVDLGIIATFLSESKDTDSEYLETQRLLKIRMLHNRNSFSSQILGSEIIDISLEINHNNIESTLGFFKILLESELFPTIKTCRTMTEKLCEIENHTGSIKYRKIIDLLQKIITV